MFTSAATSGLSSMVRRPKEAAPLGGLPVERRLNACGRERLCRRGMRLLAALGFCLLVAAVPLVHLLPEAVWAGRREGVLDGSRTEAERETEQSGPRGASSPDRGEQSTRDQGRGDWEPGFGQHGHDGRSMDQDRDGPPATMLDLIKRMAAPMYGGHQAAQASHRELASGEVLGLGLSPAAIAKARGLGFGIAHSHHGGQGRVTLLEPPPGMDVAAARELLRTELPGEQLGLNYTYRPYHSAGVGDAAHQPFGVRKASAGGCDAARCYGPAVIGWQPGVRACTQHARIGVIDTLVDLEHPTFQGRNIQTSSFRPPGTSPAVSRHGTGVLAILAGNPNSGTPGLAPDAQYFAADVYRAGDAGEAVSDTLSLLRAIDWMRASSVGLINMSLSGPNDELLRKAIVDMSSRGILFVAAAGNGGPNAAPSYPAAYPEVVAVTAVDRDLRGYIHANHGDYIDIAAPGVGIWTALPNALEGYLSGTSLATPHATAILAAVAERVQDKTKSGYLRALVIRDLGPQGQDRIYGRGLALAPAGCMPHNAPGDWITSVVGTPPIVPSAAFK